MQMRGSGWAAAQMTRASAKSAGNGPASWAGSRWARRAPPPLATGPRHLASSALLPSRNPENEEPLLFLGLREIIKGHVPLGGARSRGLGRVSLTVGEAILVDGEDRMVLLAYLTQDKVQTPTWEELEESIPAYVQTLVRGKGANDA